MGTNLGTGIWATTNSEWDMTFLWSVTGDADGNLLVEVNYGPGIGSQLLGSATIPAGVTSPVELTDAGDPEITVHGDVTAIWASDGESYVVTFSGGMTYTNSLNATNVFSSNLNGAPGDAAEIIVCGYIN